MEHPRRGIDEAELRGLALDALGSEGDDGAGLTDVERLLIDLAVTAVTTSLDVAALRHAIAAALDGGSQIILFVLVRSLILSLFPAADRVPQSFAVFGASGNAVAFPTWCAPLVHPETSADPGRRWGNSATLSVDRCKAVPSP